MVSQAVVGAFGAAADRRREVLDVDVGDSENEGFWTAFLRSMKTRGLDGVKLAISDAHAGLKKAIATVFQGVSWQRCRMHFMRNVLSIVPKGSQGMVGSIIRTAFAQPDEWEAGDRRYLSEASMTELKTMNTTTTAPVEEGILLPEFTAA